MPVIYLGRRYSMVHTCKINTFRYISFLSKSTIKYKVHKLVNSKGWGRPGSLKAHTRSNGGIKGLIGMDLTSPIQDDIYFQKKWVPQVLCEGEREKDI